MEDCVEDSEEWGSTVFNDVIVLLLIDAPIPCLYTLWKKKNVNQPLHISPLFLSLSSFCFHLHPLQLFLLILNFPKLGKY